MLRADRFAGVAGYSLIEVLVALVVLSIGLLGLARMQLTGLRYANSAAERFEAVTSAHEILERMRANRNPALAGDYDVAIGGTSTSGGQAQADVEQWKASLAAALPGGDGSVEVVSRIATITVQWSEEWDAQSDGLAAVRLRSQL